MLVNAALSSPPFKRAWFMERLRKGMAEPKREGHEKLMQIKVMAQRASVMKALSAWRTIVLGYRVDPEASLAACGWPMAPSARLPRWSC